MCIIGAMPWPNSGPPQQRDEEGLKGDTRNDWRHRRAPEAETRLRSVDVCREDGEQKQDQRHGRGTPGAWHQQPDGSKDLAEARERDHEPGVRHEGRHHRDQVGPQAVEVSCRGEAEHHRQADTGRCGPTPQAWRADLPTQAREQCGNDEHDQWDHQSVSPGVRYLVASFTP